MNNGQTNIQYKFRCPKCSAVVVTVQPASMIWEQCPSCRAHTWDAYDLLMAESATGNAPRRTLPSEIGH
jgi:Zn-finger nucleic acid-binding protein